MRLLLCLMACLYPCVALAHFGLVIPSSSTVMDKTQADVKIDIAFAHPFEQEGLTMAKPREFFVVADGAKTSLTEKLTDAIYLGQAAYKAEYRIGKPGIYAFGVVPEPYFEKAEDCFIIHYAKTVIGAYGAEDGWQKPLGLPVEIIPLSRPFANYAGNCFSGLVLKNGIPLKNTIVEVEFLNAKGAHKAPNEYFVTQTVLTDGNGVFNFGIPWPGWWGFAALTESETKMDLDGEAKDVELGGVIWLEFMPIAGDK